MAESPSKTAARKESKDRREEIRALLTDRDMTPERFLMIVFEQDDVDRVDISKFGKNTWVPSKVDQVSVGFDPLTIEEYLLNKYGPARYRFSPVRQGEFVTHKLWSLGEVDESLAERQPHGGGVDDDPAPDIQREVVSHLKGVSATQQLREALADGEARQLERAVAPAKIMMDMMGMMKEALTKPASDGGSMQMFSTMMTTMLTLLTTIMQQSSAAQAESTKMLLAMMEKADRTAREPGGLTRVIEAISAIEKNLTGGLASVLDGKDKSSWVDGMVTLAPVLEKAVDVLGTRFGPAWIPGPEMRQLPAHTQPASAEGGTPVQLNPDPEMDAMLHEAATMGAEALKGRDFPTMRALLETYFADLASQIDFDANPNVYLLMLIRVEPKFKPLRAEFADFLVWLQAQQADEAAEVAPGSTVDGVGPRLVDVTKPIERRPETG